MKQHAIMALPGTFGDAVAALFGGWDNGIEVLFNFYGGGLSVALVFKKSPKTPTGAAQSFIGWKGLMKKGAILVAHQYDVIIGTAFVWDATVVAFIANETSIIENAGLMGIPIPGVILQAIDVLRSRGEREGRGDKAIDNLRMILWQSFYTLSDINWRGGAGTCNINKFKRSFRHISFIKTLNIAKLGTPKSSGHQPKKRGGLVILAQPIQ